jgi:hypothetical protein
LNDAVSVKDFGAVGDGVSASGFTVEFQRDDGITWNNGETQGFYWMAIGTN